MTVMKLRRDCIRCSTRPMEANVDYHEAKESVRCSTRLMEANVDCHKASKR